MSYMRSQTNGHVNGTGGGNPIRRLEWETSDTSADERSRSRRGGYGDFGRPQQPQPQQQAEHVPRVARLDRGHAQRRSREYDWSQSRSRSRPATSRRYGGATENQVEGIYYILATSAIYIPQQAHT